MYSSHPRRRTRKQQAKNTPNKQEQNLNTISFLQQSDDNSKTRFIVPHKIKVNDDQDTIKCSFKKNVIKKQERDTIKSQEKQIKGQKKVGSISQRNQQCQIQLEKGKYRQAEDVIGIKGNVRSYEKNNYVNVRPQIAYPKSTILQQNIRQKQIQKIINSCPLRQKLAQYLPDYNRYQISFEHHHLLRILQALDTTIQFYRTNRGINSIFLGELRRNIKQSIKLYIEIQNIQQIMYLYQNAYILKWQIRDGNYDIKILILQKIQNRKQKLKQKIVYYLMIKQKQYRDKYSIQKQQYGWCKGFNWNIKIPKKPLPTHPTLIKSVLNQNKQYSKNPILNALINKKKYDNQVQSVNSVQVAQCIFGLNKSKCSLKDYQNKLYDTLRLKQIQAQAHRSLPKQETIDYQRMIDCVGEITLIYMSKNVNSIFKITLFDLLKKRLRDSDANIEIYLNFIINNEIRFLREVKTTKGVVAVIDKTKMKDMQALIRATIEEKFKKEKQRAEELQMKKEKILKQKVQATQELKVCSEEIRGTQQSNFLRQNNVAIQ